MYYTCLSSLHQAFRHEPMVFGAKQEHRSTLGERSPLVRIPLVQRGNRTCSKRAQKSTCCLRVLTDSPWANSCTRRRDRLSRFPTNASWRPLSGVFRRMGTVHVVIDYDKRMHLGGVGSHGACTFIDPRRAACTSTCFNRSLFLFNVSDHPNTISLRQAFSHPGSLDATARC